MSKVILLIAFDVLILINLNTNTKIFYIINNLFSYKLLKDTVQAFQIPYSTTLTCPNNIEAATFFVGGRYIRNACELRVRYLLL